MFFEVLLRLSFTISGEINNFLKHSVEKAVDAHADAAADWVTAGRVLFTASVSSPWCILFLWIPFSEDKLIIIVLHLLSHDSGSVAWAVVESDSVLTNMLI